MVVRPSSVKPGKPMRRLRPCKGGEWYSVGARLRSRPVIVSRENPKLKAIRRLRHRRDASALLEGPRLVEEALRLGLPFDSVLATPDFLDGETGRRLARLLSPTPLAVSPPLLRELSDVDSPQGILAVTTLARGGPDALPRAAGALYVYAEGIQDPGNLGALARSLEAAGGAGLALAPTSAHPNHPRALRSSAGSLLRLPVACRSTPAAVDGRLRDLEPYWVALSPRGGRSLYEAELGGTLVLALGAEGAGLRPETLERCRLAITIPIAPEVESLNATVAAAVALFEIRRQRSGSI